jgi:Ca-activated chloride channel homolog
MKYRAVRPLLVLVFVLLTSVLGAVYPLSAHGSEWWTITWQHPWALVLLFAVPVLLWRGTYGVDRRVPHLRMGTIGPLRTGPIGKRAYLRDWPGVIRAVVVTLMVLAMARPVSLMRPAETTESGIDIVLVLDLSGSMRAVMEGDSSTFPDKKKKSRRLRPTRLVVAKEVIRDFVGRRKTDRIGAVVFGKNAYVLAPPTLDYQLLDHLVAKIELGMIDGTGTAIGDALGVAVARLRRSNARSKAVVLLTDGDSNAGSITPEYGAHLANVVGCKIYPIQIGTGDDAEVQDGVDLFGNPQYVRAHFPVNPELLKTVADKTGGHFYVANDGEALRKSMHDVLDKLEKTKFEAASAVYEDWFPLLLLPAALLLALDALLRAWVLRRFP